MATEEQKRLWKEEKDQQLRDQHGQRKEIRHRPVPLKLGGAKKTPRPVTPPKLGDSTSDDLLRKRLGI